MTASAATTHTHIRARLTNNAQLKVFSVCKLIKNLLDHYNTKSLCRKTEVFFVHISLSLIKFDSSSSGNEMNTSSLCSFKHTQHSDAAWALKQSQYPTLKILTRENLAEVFSPNFMCVQTHLCAHQCCSIYIPSNEDVKIIFHSLLWFMSAFEFLFFPSQNSILHFHHPQLRTKPRQFD